MADSACDSSWVSSCSTVAASGGVSSSAVSTSNTMESITGPTHEQDALRLRRALHQLRLDLQTVDSEVIDLIEEWQESLDRSERASKKAARLRLDAEEQDKDAEYHQKKASSLFQAISTKLASTAHSVHVQTAPFVQIEHQQALQLQCWILYGRKWRPVRITVGNGQLVLSRLRRSFLGRGQSFTQMTLDLDWIEAARADGSVLITAGCCGVQARWQWTCILGAAGRELCHMTELTLCCETEAAMHFWSREIYLAKGQEPQAHETIAMPPTYLERAAERAAERDSRSPLKGSMPASAKGGAATPNSPSGVATSPSSPISRFTSWRQRDRKHRTTEEPQPQSTEPDRDARSSSEPPPPPHVSIPHTPQPSPSAAPKRGVPSLAPLSSLQTDGTTSAAVPNPSAARSPTIGGTASPPDRDARLAPPLPRPTAPPPHPRSASTPGIMLGGPPPSPGPRAVPRPTSTARPPPRSVGPSMPSGLRKPAGPVPLRPPGSIPRGGPGPRAPAPVSRSSTGPPVRRSPGAPPGLMSTRVPPTAGKV